MRWTLSRPFADLWRTVAIVFNNDGRAGADSDSGLALGFIKKVENLAAAVALHVAHYNYTRYHRTIGSTPAMAAGIAGHPRTMEEMLANAGL